MHSTVTSYGTQSTVMSTVMPPNSGSMNSSLLFSIFGAVGAIVITCIIAVIVILTCIMYRRKHRSVKKKERDINDNTEVELRSTNNPQPTGLELYAISTAGGHSIESQYSVIRKGDIMEYEEVPPPIPPQYNYNEINDEQNGQSPIYSTVNTNQVSLLLYMMYLSIYVSAYISKPRSMTLNVNTIIYRIAKNFCGPKFLLILRIWKKLQKISPQNFGTQFIGLFKLKGKVNLQK
ncbi:PREDICTED: uncharacterized protein LOC109590198 [Amphimedon queenslandica]|uniref:Uncharacterized protein n=1 Tax=Amphimedon queenslandica TaxID=400682 RepID=A0AAN0JX46_AMPQE|nr:PREDICTED: uncharacterized protein LOC109590198 [Amphimedon queenslandica]|eukprot:XP_019861676.1 PREDICTED: uncharacterized protein LOC109590198 [Amphimedon queenslandica]